MKQEPIDYDENEDESDEMQFRDNDDDLEVLLNKTLFFSVYVVRKRVAV